ncbi:MAG: hypothetical protein JF616_21035 [Fibrobacteres bacterium]|nr:hypothetical protein [Fibrobacterota bacterium]
MIYEPFDNCVESAKVDSTQEWTVVMDPDMAPTPPPYRSLYTATYHPGTCMLAKDFYLGYWMDKPNIGTYTLRPGTKTTDYVGDFSDGTQSKGTNYYTAGTAMPGTRGMDSSDAIETVTDEMGNKVTWTTRTSSLAKPGYELLQVRHREGTGPWTLTEQDSVVMNGAGKVIYSTGDVIAVTTCVSTGKTYTCTPVVTKSQDAQFTKAYYLTGGRVDSLQYINKNGVHIMTEKWFWSSRSGSRIAGKAGVSSLRMANPGTSFDVTGRKVSNPDRAQLRFKLIGARKN